MLDVKGFSRGENSTKDIIRKSEEDEILI